MKQTQNTPQAKDIIYFETTTVGHQTQNIIKNYLNYLKCHQLKGPYRFCHVQSDYELIESMTLRENIYLDTMPVSLTQSQDRQFYGQMKSQTNNHLIKLLNGIDSLDSLPAHSDQRTRKILGLSKALMQDVDYLFFESPEKHLDNTDLELFVQALQFHLGLHDKTVLVSSDRPKLWLPYATKRVFRDDKSKFSTEDLSQKKLQKFFLRSTEEDFSEPEEGLIIHLGEWESKKVA